MKLPIDKIRTDGGTQPRAAIDRRTVDEYQREMEEGQVFPGVDVFFDGTSYWLAEGFHRIEATYGAGFDDIDVTIHQGTVEDAKWFSFGANKDHGLRRSNEDKQRAVKSALQHPKSKGLSDNQIAEHVGVHHSTIAKWRSEVASCGNSKIPTTRTATRNGKTYEMDTTNIGRRPQQSKEVVVNPGPNHDDGGGEYQSVAPPTEQPEQTGPTNDEFWNNVQAGTFLECIRTIADCPLTSAEILEYLKERGTENDLDAIARSYEFLGNIIEQSQQ